MQQIKQTIKINKILLVEDSPTQAMVTRRLLEDGGIPEIMNAENGLVALALLQKNKPDLIISDILMPEMDGFQLCQEIRNNPRLADIPIILQTASYQSSEDADFGLDTGADAYIPKGSTTEELMGIIKKVASQKRKGIKAEWAKDNKGYSEFDLLNHQRMLYNLIEKSAALEQANTYLIESENRFKQVAEISGEWIWETDLHGKFQYVSPLAEQILGYSEKEIIGEKYIWDFCTSIIKEELKEIVHSVIKLNKPLTEIVFDCVKKNAQIVTLESNLIPSTDFNGKITGIRGISTDITERKRTEKKIADLAKFPSENPNPVLRIDRSGVLLYINDAGKNQMGEWNLQVGKLVQLELQDVITRAISKKQTISVEFNFDGRMFTFYITPEATGEYANVYGLDITQRIKAEETIRESEEKYRSVTEDSPGMICRFTPDGTINFVNRSYCDFFLKEQEELIGSNIRSTFPAQSEDNILSNMNLINKQSPILTFENENIIDGKPTRWVRWTNRGLFNKDGQIVNIQSFGLDISEKVRTEKLLNALNQASIAMESELTPNGIFAAVANELNKLNISCLLFPVDESQQNLVIKFLGFKPSLKNIFKNLVGINEEEFSFSIDSVDVYREVVNERKSIFSEESEEIIRQVLPMVPKKVISELIKLKHFQKGVLFPLIIDEKVKGVFSAHSENLTKEDVPIILAFADRLASAWEKTSLIEDLQKTVDGTIHIAAAMVEARDPYTAGHQARVAELAAAIAAEMHLEGDQIQGILMAGRIHDLGKIQIPAEILSKPGKITSLEFDLIKTHPQVGYGLLQGFDFPWPLAEMVRQHHEKIDGSGYPQGLKGDEILLESRILAVADIVEAMSSHRPYRPALGLDKALEQIKHDKGTLLDGAVVDACLRVFKKGYNLFTVTT